MQFRYRLGKTSGHIGLLFIVALLVFLVFAKTGFAGEGLSEKLVQGQMGSPEIRQKLELATINQTLMDLVEAKLEERANDQVFLDKIAAVPAGEKMTAFLKAMHEAESLGFDTSDLLRAKLSKIQANQSRVGSISGTVMVDGTLNGADAVQVIAFDTFGFFVGLSGVDGQSGAYSIDDLPDGDYYVLTQGPFVNEFYNNITWDFFSNWRQATLVTVAGGTASGISFDLDRGATVTGMIADSNNLPLGGQQAAFAVVDAADPRRFFESLVVTGNLGDYSLIVPATGSFKIGTSVNGYLPEWYNGKPDFDSADPVQISSLDQTVGGINFTLDSATEAEGGSIAGTVFGPGPVVLPLSFVFAFNIADSSIANFTLSDFFGNYTISGLEPGDYILYADDYLGFAFGGGNMQGAYYANAQTSAGATVVSIVGTGSVPDIDFNLTLGGSIAGSVTDNTGAPLDSILIIAVKEFDLSAINPIFSDQIDLGLAFSGGDGSYSVNGLRDGDYILRSISLLSSNSAGVVVDEYYMDVTNILDFDLATRVTVAAPNAVSDIDFELEIGGGIAGQFFEIDGSTPISGEGSVFAFNAQTGKPEFAFSAFDTANAQYVIGPLPSGVYVLLAAAGGEEVIYLPQFYNGAATPDQATPVAVTSPGVTANINFSMVAAGTIEGFVNMASGPIGADTFSAVVVAFDANTGVTAAADNTTFSGGYRLFGLPPGNYRVAAISGIEGYGVTYFGGGTTFDDANSTAVSVVSGGAGAAARADINLIAATGSITGTVTDDNGEAIDMVIVLAYDQTGHAVSAGVSGFDLNTGAPLGPGIYQIQGLHPGNYYVRTFSLFRFNTVLDALDLGGLAEDPLGALLGLLAGGTGFLSGLDLSLFNDQWYQAVEITNDIDLISALLGLLVGGGLPLDPPLADVVDPNADVVSVGGGATTGINFQLSEGGLPTDVDEPDVIAIPDQFELLQNYPNPFNPTTVIAYRVAQASNIQLNVYNVLGQKIRTLFDGFQQTGSHVLQWDARDDSGAQVSAGIYFVRLEGDNLSLSRRMLFLK